MFDLLYSFPVKMIGVEFADFCPKDEAGVFKKSLSTLNNYALFCFVYHSNITVMVVLTSQCRFTKTKLMKK